MCRKHEFTRTPEVLEQRTFLAASPVSSSNLFLSGYTPEAQYSDLIEVTAGETSAGITFDNWSSDDVAMLIGAHESISITYDGNLWTVLIPDDAILLRDTDGYFGLGNWDFKPISFRNESDTASFTMIPSYAIEENTYHVIDFEAGGFSTRDGITGVSAHELLERGWASNGPALVKLAWVGDAGYLRAQARFIAASPGADANSSVAETPVDVVVPTAEEAGHAEGIIPPWPAPEPPTAEPWTNSDAPDQLPPSASSSEELVSFLLGQENG